MQVFAEIDSASRFMSKGEFTIVIECIQMYSKAGTIAHGRGERGQEPVNVVESRTLQSIPNTVGNQRYLRFFVHLLSLTCCVLLSIVVL